MGPDFAEGFGKKKENDDRDPKRRKSTRKAEGMGYISRIKEEIAVIRQRDPAIHSNMEVFLYPSFKVRIHYRRAHKMYLKKK